MGNGVTPVSDPVMDGINRSIQAVQTPIAQFFCPSRRLPMHLPVTGDWYTQPESSGKSFAHAPTDYAASNSSESYTLNGTTISVPYRPWNSPQDGRHRRQPAHPGDHGQGPRRALANFLPG